MTDTRGPLTAEEIAEIQACNDEGESRMENRGYFEHDEPLLIHNHRAKLLTHIEHLSAENTALRGDIARKDEALRPFAQLGRAIDDPRSPDVKRGRPAKDESVFVGQALYAEDGSVEHNPITFGDLRRAASALTDGETKV